MRLTMAHEVGEFNRWRGRGPARPLVPLHENLYGVKVSPDGQHAVYIAGREVSNLVMLQNFR